MYSTYINLEVNGDFIKRYLPFRWKIQEELFCLSWKNSVPLMVVYMSASFEVVLLLTFRRTEWLKYTVLFSIAQLGLYITGNASLRHFKSGGHSAFEIKAEYKRSG